MESWRTVFRKGLAPLLSDLNLAALRDGLLKDDPRLLQGATTTPPPLACVQDWPTEAACLIGYAAWQGEFSGDASVAEIEEFFAKACFEMDQNIGEPAACRWLLNWYDDAPRDEMRRELLLEVQRTIIERDECRNNSDCSLT